jgi:hypothetical protein
LNFLLCRLNFDFLRIRQYSSKTQKKGFFPFKI